MPNAKMSSSLLQDANLANTESPTLLFSSTRHLTHKLLCLAKACSVTHCNSHQFQTVFSPCYLVYPVCMCLMATVMVGILSCSEMLLSARL